MFLAGCWGPESRRRGGDAGIAELSQREVPYRVYPSIKACYAGCLEGVPKSVQVLCIGIEAVVLLYYRTSDPLGAASRFKVGWVFLEGPFNRRNSVITYVSLGIQIAQSR